jgi:hypothetical protein
MPALYVPPSYAFPDPVHIYSIGRATNEMSFEAPFITRQHHYDFEANVRQWLRYIRCAAEPALSKEQRSASVALGRVLERTRWSYRDVGSIIGVTHTQARRIQQGEQRPRDEVVRRIYDLDAITAALWTPASRDDARLRMALQTRPAGALQSAIQIVQDRHDPAAAIMQAARVLHPPQIGMATIDVATIHVPDPERGIAADFGD